MIGGLLIDAMVIGAVVAFAWAATMLGGLSTLFRLGEAIAAFSVAALLRDPAGSVIHEFIGTSEDFSRLIGMGLVGLATYIGANRLFTWWRGNREAARNSDVETHEDIVDEDPLDSVALARFAGGALGLGWALLFVSLLVLQPASTVVSRAAIASRVGGQLIDQEQALRWLNEGFPHYTQALPKGTLGAVVGETRSLPMREPVEATERARDHDQLLRRINGLRRDQRSRVLAFNPDIAAVARRHAIGLAEEQTLSYSDTGGAKLDDRVKAALGEAVGEFTDDVGIEVAWAHDPATAYRGLLDSRRAQTEIRDPKWSEVGIGVADAGWFNGRIYVLLLVSHKSAEATRDEQLAAEGDPGAAAAAGIVEESGVVEDTTASAVDETDG
ncbi:MAG: hypothetical protein JWL76_2191 [Thermoleophilia bacterium]|nr:hypothetical protein [Thermoleophilia bacterium]